MWKEISPFKQMAFISGPRQAGKTTFTKDLSKEYKNRLYYNWDIIENKKKLIENPSFYEEVKRNDNSTPLIIFDEIHKYENWKNYLKSVYDKHAGEYKFVVSGSGRLDIFKKGGDSLAGRYLLFHLWPLTLAELADEHPVIETFLENPLELYGGNNKNIHEIWETLSQCSGFPDPFLQGKKTYYRMWSRTYKNQLMREDLRDVVQIKKYDDIETLFSLLPSKVGSPLSMDNLARNIQVSFDSVKKWLAILEDFFLIFRISPWTKKISRALSKEKKAYFFDYAGIESESAKFENMVAVELWRAVWNWTERGFGNFNLHYIRNKEKEEVDFLISRENKPLLLIECKLSDDRPSKSLFKFQNSLQIPAIQLINKKEGYQLISNGPRKILVCSAAWWLSGLL